MFTLIKNVHVYQPEDIGINDIFICNDKIIEVGPDLDYHLPNLELIDGTGKTAVPGYIDQHVHVTGGGGEGSFKTRVPELVLSQCIHAGVTTLVGLLGTDALTRSVENLVAKTKALNEEGITAYCLTGSYEYPTRTITGDVKKDIAFIKEVIGVKVAISDHRSSHMTKQELTRLVSDVRMASLISGKPGIVVFHMGKGKDQLDTIFAMIRETELPIKHFRPTHVQKVFDQAVEFAKLGGYIDFTAGSNTSQTATHIVKALKADAPRGRITISTDSNGSMPKWNEKNELVGIVAAAMTSLHETVKALIKEQDFDISTALGFVTSNVAQALEIQATKGSISQGLDADILLLDDNLDIDTVVARGRVMMHGRELEMKGTFEQ